MSEEQFSELFHRAAGPVRGNPEPVIEASVRDGGRRARRRRLRHVASVALAGAVVGSALTYGLRGWPDGDDARVVVAESVPTTYGVPVDEMVPALTSQVSRGHVIRSQSGSVPPWFGDGPLGSHSPWSNGMRAGFVVVRFVSNFDRHFTYSLAVAVDRVPYSGERASLTTLCKRAPNRYSCVPTGDGLVLLSDHTTSSGKIHRSAVRLVKTGWLVEVQSQGRAGSPSPSQIATDSQWLK